MNILIFGGTTEGRLLCEKLAAGPHRVTVSVATELGAEELAGVPDLTVLCGRLDQNAMEKLLPGFDLCVDATHPYAVEATGNIRRAAETLEVPLRRLVRPESALRDVTVVDSAQAAAAFLSEVPGNILLTTGAKELPAFDGLPRERLFARVLPTHQGIAACEALGLRHRNILALQGPFTREMNEAMLAQYHIAWLVTKDGGGPGGYEEKIAAARAKGAGVVLIRRPEENGVSLEDLQRELEALTCM